MKNKAARAVVEGNDEEKYRITDDGKVRLVALAQRYCDDYHLDEEDIMTFFTLCIFLTPESIEKVRAYVFSRWPEAPLLEKLDVLILTKQTLGQEPN